MKETPVLIIGASFSGLASAASLQSQKINYVIIDKESQVGEPWHRHYDRLHLHTNKRASNLPFKKFGPAIPRYPSRMQVIEYLNAYRDFFKIEPVFHCEAMAISREGKYWITETNGEVFRSSFVIVATGAFGKARNVSIKGMESFPGKIIHSSRYKSGKEFNGERVLVIGFGNSACEIAIDLYEQGARPALSVRSPVNVIPRDILGVPILDVSMVLSRFPTGVADAISAPLLRVIFGDITRLGLQKKSYGPFSEIEKDGTIPVLDIGVIKHISKGNVALFKGIDHIENKTVYFKDGDAEEFDAIVAAVGYEKNYPPFLQLDNERLNDLQVSVDHQKYFGKDGLYFCGFWVGPTGQIREISRDARKIAVDIRNKWQAV